MYRKDLLIYYNQELAFIRKFAQEFSRAHPEVAGELKLGIKGIENPHITRLIEACALLNARIQAKIDDDFPELFEALFSVLYPHYYAPIPSMSVVHFAVKDPELQEAYDIARNTKLQTDSIDGVRCYFRTAYPVTLLPLKIQQCKFGLASGITPKLHNSDVTSSLQIHLSCLSDNITMQKLAPKKLRFYINLPTSYAHILYELLFNHAVQIVLTDECKQKNINLQALQQVGFAVDEGLLSYSAKSFMGYRLLTEFFIFPEKFLFFDVNFTDEQIWHDFGNEVTLSLYFNKTSHELEQQITKNSLMLSCAPVINLFDLHAKPIHLNHTKFEYQINPDCSQPQDSVEVCAIKKVIGIASDGAETNYLPFYGTKYHAPEQQHFWYAVRKAACQGEHYHLKGTELFISLVDNSFAASSQQNSIIDVELLCTNRNLPAKLPFHDDKLNMYLEDSSDYVGDIFCLLPPTISYFPDAARDKSWQLISHLSSMNLSCSATELKNILQLYSLKQSATVQNMLNGILTVKTKPITARCVNATDYYFWHGTEIIIEVDEDKFLEKDLFLFTSVMDYFFALYATFNSFTQLKIINKNRGELYRCHPRAGAQTLL